MVVDWTDFDWYEYIKSFGLVPKPKRNMGKDKKRIIDAYCAFDIETSTVWLNDDRSLYDVHSFMYIWQFQIEEHTVIGRTWPEFMSFLHCLTMVLFKLKKHYNTVEEPKLIIWVHNLSYEFAFLSGIYKFENEDVFFRDVRKPIYCRMFQHFEFRCSYIQTNLSLSALTKQMGVPVKLSGQKFDYNKVRFPWTELTDYELEYCITDVQSLVLAMKKRVQMNGDNLATVPITSTGYVRRDCKASLTDRFYDINEMKPDERQYRLLRKAFRGGNTHANRAYAGKIIKDVYSYDIVSCYPTQQLTQRFPMKPFRWLDERLTLDRVFKFIGLGYAVVGLYQFKGLRLKNKKTPIPYISLGRCDALNWKLDNGRILECDYVEIALTELDLEIVLRQYVFDEVQIMDCMVAQKDFLPEEYRAVIQSYFNKKTALKGDDSDEGQYQYVKSKNMLNSVYGMSATDPIHQEILYNDGNYTRSSYDTMTEEEKQKALRSAPFPYQWGIYTTALSRFQLQSAIDLCGDKIIYCDTDSVKTKGQAPILNLNEKLQAKAIQRRAYADDMNGHRHYIGLFEQDAYYDKFITQGAKRYAYEKGGHLGVTVSGVTKQRNEETGEYFAVEELKKLENFKVGMTWDKAGGTMAVYNDNDNFVYTDPETDHSLTITKNVAIIPTTYTMTYAKDYALLLNEIKLYGEYKSERE